MNQRRKVILRQVLSPPYVYRWGVLIGTVSTVVALSATAIAQVAEGATPSAPAAAVLPAVAAPPRLARTVSSRLVTLTARPGRSVALTFDDGPDPQYTRRVLALLAEHDAKATFCMIGDQATRHPEIVREVVDAGMALCDHTVAHDTQIGHRDAAALESELVTSGQTLSAAAGAGVPIRFFRAPEGRWTVPLQRAAARHGLWSLGWSVDSLDWTRPGVDRIVADVKRQVSPGAVILFHDGGGPREQTLAALEQLLPWLTEQGYRFDLPA